MVLFILLGLFVGSNGGFLPSLLFSFLLGSRLLFGGHPGLFLIGLGHAVDNSGLGARSRLSVLLGETSERLILLLLFVILVRSVLVFGKRSILVRSRGGSLRLRLLLLRLGLFSGLLLVLLLQVYYKSKIN